MVLVNQNYAPEGRQMREVPLYIRLVDSPDGIVKFRFAEYLEYSGDKYDSTLRYLSESDRIIFSAADSGKYMLSSCALKKYSRQAKVADGEVVSITFTFFLDGHHDREEQKMIDPIWESILQLLADNGFIKYDQ